MPKEPNQPAEAKKNQQQQRKTTGETLRKIMPFIAPFKWKIAGLALLTAVLSVLAMLPPLFTRAIINEVVGNRREALLPGLAVMMILVPLLHAAISYIQLVGIAYIGQTFVLRIRMAVYRHLLGMHIGYFHKNSTGKLTNRLMGDSSTMQQILNVTSVQVISDLVCALFAASATLYLNWRLALPIIVVLVLFVSNYRFNISKIRRAWISVRGSEDRLASGVQDRLVANLTVKTYGAEDREQRVFNTQATALMDNLVVSWSASSNFHLNTLLLQDMGRTCIYFLGCAMVLANAASYGDVTAFTTYAMQILWPAVRFSQLAEQLQNVRISADRLFEILDAQPEVLERADAVRLEGAVRGDVDFDDVTFWYEPDKVILRNFDIHVKAGETVALVGPTGCGKTTILSLLMRLYDVQHGAVRIDGIDVKDIARASLRRQFGIVLQESLLFQVSIADNIRYAKPGASLEEVVNAAKIAEIHDDIIAMSDGYESVIGTRGVQLSVGQKQRISIARAVLANPAILIMDEATSALDSESERAIQVAMDRFLVNRTSFIVAHRLSTIRNADRIILLDRGEIQEMGDHETLMAIEGGRYRELYRKHSGKGVISDEED
ncbi:MAG: ABC transporter ATP-binding protein [Kiritimatiellia bacterium]|jgi:subfamily B ATP-binding cassette protein MsbA